MVLAAVLRDAIRSFRRKPAQLLVPAAILSVGLAASAVSVDLVDELLFRPPPHVEEPSNLFFLTSIDNYPRYLTFLERRPDILATAYSRTKQPFGLDTAAGHLVLECVTPSYFATLGVSTTAPSGISGATPGPSTAVVSSRFWSAHFVADASAPERLLIAGRGFDVAGIAPPGFFGLEDARVDVWIDLATHADLCSFTGTSLLYSDRGSWLSTVVRVSRQAEMPRLQAELLSIAKADGLFRRPDEVHPKRLHEARTVRLAQYHGPSLWLLGGAATLLLMACTSVSGILLMRGASKTQELWIRRQLGAETRWILIGQLAESLAIASVAVAGAVLLAGWLWSLLANIFPVYADGPLPNPRLFLIASAFGACACVIFSISPMWYTWSAARIVGAAREDTRVISPATSRRLILAMQLALTVALGVLATLFHRSVVNAKSHVGYDIENVTVLSFESRHFKQRSGSELDPLFDELVSRLRTAPQVAAVALNSGPLLGSESNALVMVVSSSPDDSERPANVVNLVGPDYFETIGTRLLEGREFLPSDVRGSPPVAIVDERFAAKLWPGQPRVGKCLYVFRKCAVVVGVSEARRSLSLRTYTDEVFLPLSQSPVPTVPDRILMRSNDGGAIPRYVADIVRSYGDPELVKVERLESYADAETRALRAGGVAFASFGIISLLLAVIGLWAAFTFWVRQRRQEIATRLALGARKNHIVRLLLSQVAVIVLPGCVVGSGIALAGARYLQPTLYGVSGYQCGTVVIAWCVTVGLVAFSGCLWPTWRATAVPPALGLRCG